MREGLLDVHIDVAVTIPVLYASSACLPNGFGLERQALTCATDLGPGARAARWLHRTETFLDLTLTFRD